MAISYCSSLSPCIQFQQPCSFTKPVCRFLMVKKSTKLHIISCFQNKVFEDQSKGIICYVDDETGEMICEGYDEGPRFQQQTPTTVCQQRDEEIIHLLQQNWDRKDEEYSYADKSISVEVELKWPST